MQIKERCTLCNNLIEKRYNPMEGWEIKGPLCGKCYSEKIDEHYPGEHSRVNTEKD